MISSLLLSFALAGVPADSALTPTQTDDPAVQLWISDDRRFLPGDRAKVQVRTRDDGYLLVLHVDTEGHVRVLFPIDPRDDDFVRGGRKYEIRGRGGREAFTADSRTGQGTVYAAARRILSNSMATCLVIIGTTEHSLPSGCPPSRKAN